MRFAIPPYISCAGFTARSGRDEAIQHPRLQPGLLRYARNDDLMFIAMKMRMIHLSQLFL
jgi:hypothetical protein